MTRTTSLLCLSPEIIRIIAINLELQDLVWFQGSHATILEATTDVSFYYSYFKTHFCSAAIGALIFNQNLIANRENVLWRLCDDGFESSYTFYSFGKDWVVHRILVAPYVLGTKLERRGFEMGILFANVYRDLCRSRDPFPIAHVHERIFKLRDENPQLVKIQYWTFLEDHLYSDFDVY